MSNDIQKADQIAHRFYTKLCLVVSNARATSELKSQSKVDKWFNLETPDSDLFKDHLRIYKAVSTAPAPPPFELQVLLSVPDLITNQVLVHLAHDSSRSRVDPTPRHIVLENWLINFVPEPHRDNDADSVAPSTIYKHGIPLFRSIYSLLRVLPSWKLYKKLRRRTSNAFRNGNLSIHLRVKGLDDGVSVTDILDFDTPPAPNASPLQHQTHFFPAIPHPSGTLSLTITYLSSPNFQLDELESLLSSRFLSLDEGPEFTPTLAKNQQRDSLTGLPGSLPLRASLPKSPPSSIADRFVLPAANSHSRTNSMPVSQSPRLGALPMSRTSTGAGINAGSTSALSIASSRQDSSTAWSKEDTGPVSGVSAGVFRTFPLPQGHFRSEDRVSTRSIHSRRLHYHQALHPSTHLPLLCVNRHHSPQEIHHCLLARYQRHRIPLVLFPTPRLDLVGNHPVVLEAGQRARTHLRRFQQGSVIPAVLDIATLQPEVGGASEVQEVGNEQRVPPSLVYPLMTMRYLSLSKILMRGSHLMLNVNHRLHLRRAYPLRPRIPNLTPWAPRVRC